MHFNLSRLIQSPPSDPDSLLFLSGGLFLHPDETFSPNFLAVVPSKTRSGRCSSKTVPFGGRRGGLFLSVSLLDGNEGYVRESGDDHFCSEWLFVFGCNKQTNIVIYPNSGETYDGQSKQWVPSSGWVDAEFADIIYNVINITKNRL
ncbi:hypothetical protein ACLB2K_035593 [Fragaria x ananassa]